MTDHITFYKHDWMYNARWIERNPDGHLQALILPVADGGIAAILSHTTSHDPYTGMGFEIPYPTFMQETVVAPRFTLSPTEDITLKIEWV